MTLKTVYIDALHVDQMICSCLKVQSHLHLFGEILQAIPSHLNRNLHNLDFPDWVKKFP